MDYIDMTENIPVPAIIMDKNEAIISFNQLMKSRLGNKIELGTKIKDIFSVWKIDENTVIINATFRNERFLFICNRLSDSENTLLVGVEKSELSKLKNENEDLKNLNRELDAIIENSYDGIYITDHEGVTWKTNSAIERITGIPKEYYIGKNVNDLIKRGILESSVTPKVIEKRRTVSLVQPNFAGKETLLTGTPVFNDEGQVEKIVTNIRDLSDLNELQTELRKANELNEKYRKELDLLKNQPQLSDGVVINSSQMKMIYDTADRIANIDATVLILGDTGVGKDILAKYIFNKSTRSREGEFIKINCGAIPPDLLESELFGYEGGAFTGANRQGKPGMFEVADKGILFLDEIGELPLGLQVKLLRVLQEGEIQRIGGTKPKKVDVRIMAATNRNLLDMIAKGSFREDLYYRLNVIPFVIPPLKDRRDDILGLTQLFLEQANDRYQMTKQLDYGLKDFIYSYNWPGNIRELANLVERLVVTTPNEVINTENLPPEYRESNDTAITSIVPLKNAVETAEEKVLSLAVQQWGSTYDIAKILETSQPTIVRKLKKYNLRVKDNSDT